MTWSEVKTELKLLLPPMIRQFWRRHRVEVIRRRNRKRGVAEIFHEIYQQNRWGGQQGEFHSGSGSTTEHAEQYGRLIRDFIRDHRVGHVIDLGCGDYRVGAQLRVPDVRYTGIDIVADLIENNSRLHGSELVRFECRDIIEDALPEGDLCLVRQVLQHLSNAQISRVLDNVERYQYVIVTEHYPAPDTLRGKNYDKPCGEDIRIYDGSGVFLDAPPFSRKVAELLLDVNAGHYIVRPGERIRSYLLKNGGRQ